MKKERFLIVFMIIAMLTLVTLQGYWLRSAAEVKEDQFNRNVKAALIETVKKIERRELIYRTQQMLENKQQNKVLSTQAANDINSVLSRKRNSSELNQLFNDYFFFEYRDKFNSLGEKVPENTSTASQYINDRLIQENENFKEFIRKNSALDHKYNEIIEINSWLDSSKLNTMDLPFSLSNEINTDGLPLDMVKGIVQDLILGERNITERLGYMMLDTLLRVELNNLGISTAFQYAVEDQGNLVMVSAKQLALEDGYKIRLFPGDYFPNTQFLYVIFPDKDNFIYKNMAGLFMTSLVMVLLVGGIFYYSANSLISGRKLAEIKSDFINNMTHELKTPVSSIALAIEVIQDKGVAKSEEKVGRYLGIIKEENDRQALQIERVLQMAKLEQKQVMLNLEVLDLNHVLESVVRTMEMRLTNVQFSKNLKAKNAETQGDRIHITNIFLNLLDNALKYSVDSPKLELITSNPTDNLIRIEVIDNGIGISRQDTERIFDNFYRVPTGNIHNVKGFGLGLGYVKSMVKMHRGTVHVKSKLGDGSIFWIDFPTTKT